MLKSIIKYQIFNLCIENMFDSAISNILMGKLPAKIVKGAYFRTISTQFKKYHNCEIIHMSRSYILIDYLFAEIKKSGKFSISVDCPKDKKHNSDILHSKNIIWKVPSFNSTHGMLINNEPETFLSYAHTLQIDKSTESILINDKFLEFHK